MPSGFNLRRLPFFRTEISAAFDAGESSQIWSIRFNPTATSLNLPGEGAMSLANEDVHSTRPIMIYDYKLEYASDTLCQAFQYYGDTDDLNNLTNWDPTNQEFVQGLKQHRMIAGSINRYVDTTTIPDTIATNSQYDRSVLSYRAKGYYSKKHKEWRWIRPPIVLSNNKGNYFGISLANVGQSDDRKFMTTLTIKKWGQII
jgi:hypothetical protein